MKEQTKKLVEIFATTTGHMPKSARLNGGSMRGSIQFKMPYSEELKEFTDTERFYTKKERNFHGVDIEFLGNNFGEEYHKKHGYEFTVNITNLNKIIQ